MKRNSTNSRCLLVNVLALRSARAICKIAAAERVSQANVCSDSLWIIIHWPHDTLKWLQRVRENKKNWATARRRKMYLGPRGSSHREPGRGWAAAGPSLTKSSFHQHQGKSRDRRRMEGGGCEQQTLFLPPLNHHLFNYTLKAQGHPLLSWWLIARGSSHAKGDLIHRIRICPWLIEGRIMNLNYLLPSTWSCG